MKKERINTLLKQRDALIKKDFKNKRIDEIQSIISKAIRKNFDNYDVDFILETWTRFGASPALVHDDNGMFAVSFDGFQPVATGKERVEGAFTVFVKQGQWKKTIRGAVKHHVNKLSLIKPI